MCIASGTNVYVRFGTGPRGERSQLMELLLA
jgi:hypothetical protein